LSRSFADWGALSLPVTILWGVIVAPLAEEIVYRGFVFRVLQQRWGTAAGMLASSALFAVVHFYSMVGTIEVFASGMILAWLYHRTGKLASCILLHAGYNLALALYGHFAGA
jgi:hypothetical protein